MSEIDKINELFGQAMFLDFSSKRFGIQSCQNSVDKNLAYDLKLMYERALEQKTCLEEDLCCNIEKLKEKINTL